MKPKNFPGRKAERRRRADLRAIGIRATGDPGQGARYTAHPTVADIRFRVGGKNRGPDGVGTDVAIKKGANT